MNYEQYASLVMPETAILELTEYCNFNCVHCYETHQRESLLDIDDYIEEKARQAPSPRIGEVHQQQCDADDAEGGFRQTGHNSVQTIGSPACAENTLHDVAAAAILIFLFLLQTGQVRILWRLAQSGAGEAGPMLFAEGQRLAAAVDFVCQTAFRPATITVMIAVYGFPESLRFTVRFKAQSLDSGIAVHQADVLLCSKLRVGASLSPDDRPVPELCQTDNTLWDAVFPGFHHDPLLIIDSGDNIQTFCLLFGKFCTVLDKFDHISYVSADILQLFADCGTNGSGVALLAFGQAQMVLPRPPAIHPQFLSTRLFAQFLHRFLRFLPYLVEQIDVLGVCDVRRATDGVQNQRSAVGRIVPVVRIVRLLCLRFWNGGFQNGGQVFLAEPFPERHQCGRSERA